jgi:hypothetical protein
MYSLGQHRQQQHGNEQVHGNQTRPDLSALQVGGH